MFSFPFNGYLLESKTLARNLSCVGLVINDSADSGQTLPWLKFDAVTDLVFVSVSIEFLLLLLFSFFSPDFFG